jgi:tRNA(Ile)-lysidine synthase
MFDPVAHLLELTGPRPHVLVAFSGGVDSTVLAHALAQQRRKLGGLRLVHIDHGLQTASADWSKSCARVARWLGTPFSSFKADIPRRLGDSPEAAARDARYALLAQAMKPGEVLVTAQHRDDQVETLLLQLLRGAGVAGLAAMPAMARFGPGQIARPMLGMPRAEILAYAKKHALRWIDDPTNAETRFARNFLRLRVLPLLRERWPGLDVAVMRSATHMAEAQALLAAQADGDLAAAADGDGVSVATLRTLPLARRRNALRRFLARSGVEMPEASRLAEISGPMLEARADAQPEVRWRGAAIRRRDGRLVLEVISEKHDVPPGEIQSKSWNWTEQRECIVNHAGDTIELIEDAAGPIDLERLPPVLEIRARAGGEHLRPGLRARTQALKKLIQAARMPVEARARLPLLFSGDRLIAAGERWIDASVAANDKSRRRARLKWTRAR